jgi:hypothetical protein
MMDPKLELPELLLNCAVPNQKLFKALNASQVPPDAKEDQRRGIFVLAKRVVAISEIGVCQNVEGSFEVGKVPVF